MLSLCIGYSHIIFIIHVIGNLGLELNEQVILCRGEKHQV